MVGNHEDAVKTGGGWEFDDKVHGNGFEREGGVCNRDRAMGNTGPGSEQLSGLAGGAAMDEGRDEVLYMGPPVVSCKEVASFEDARVAGSWRVMV